MAEVTFVEPWQDSLAARLSKLSKARFRILYFYEAPDSASFRYRCYNMVQAINAGQEGVRAAYIFLADLEALDDPAKYADVLVVCRTRYDSHVERLIDGFRSRGKKVFFDVDDLIFDPNYTQLVASNLNFDLWGEGLDKWFSLISRLGATMSLCDEVITTNGFLATKASEFSRLPTSVLPNFLNLEQLEISRVVRAERKNGRSSDESFTLGYFSGSKSHTKDFGAIVHDLTDVFSRYGNLRLLIVGYLDLPPELLRFRDKVTYQPFTNFVQLQRLIGSVDLCLAPLQESDFTYSKSQLKFFEAGAVGVPTMATPTPVFENAISHGINGFLAHHGDWSTQISGILSSSRSRAQKVGKNAHVDALSLYHPEVQRPIILETLGAN